MDAVFTNNDDASSIALLRHLRAGAAAVDFVHRADVCSAAPHDLVAGLSPAPGTTSVWFFYCPKRFKNAQGKASGHRHRAIAGGDNTCWHSETRPKPVKGLDGATLCNLSYGRRKEEGSGRSFSRMGWCMTEYDDGNVGDHVCVLCKIYPSSSSLAKRKMIERSSGSKRKATADQVQSLPLPATKMSHLCGCVPVPVPAEEEQVQVLVQQSTLVLETQQSDQSLFPAQGEPDGEQFDIDQALQFLSESEDNTMFTMDELLGVPPGDGEDDAVKHNTHSQSQRNTCSSIDELLRSYGFSEEELLQFHNQTQGEQLFSSCSGGTPTAMAPPDAGFFQGLAF